MKSLYRLNINAFYAKLLKKQLYSNKPTLSLNSFWISQQLNCNVTTPNKEILLLDKSKRVFARPLVQNTGNFIEFAPKLIQAITKPCVAVRGIAPKFCLKTLKKKKIKILLTKKQKKRIKFSKVKKIIKPSSALFKRYKKAPRNLPISNIVLNKSYLVHNGYSWQLLTLDSPFLKKIKLGALAYRTRALSPISFTNKGKLHQVMKQSTTFKLKKVKIKRKK